MDTVNISLPKSLARKIDEIVEREGYASRSEFFRALARFYLIAEEEREPFFVPFKKVPLEQIRREMNATGLYSDKFVKSVVRGLSRSSLYASKRGPKRS